jgi:ATP-dependent RNA helicase MRH4, mitochondrial
MVLADHVGRPSGGQNRGSRKNVPGPFGGMNRRIANIDPSKREAPITRTSTPTGGKKSDKRRDFKAMRMSQVLATVGYGQRSRVKAEMEEFASFGSFKLLPSIQEAIITTVFQGMVDLKPTPVQRLAIPILLGQKDRRHPRAKSPGQREEFLLAAETGSGKTLAYLLPAINAMKTAEATDQNVAAYRERIAVEKERRSQPGYKGPKVLEPHPSTGRPRVVVLVPSAELVGQVGAVAKKLSHVVKFKSETLSAHLSPKVIERNLFSPNGVDLVISTPHLLGSIAESDPNVLSRVSHLIIDEADSLFDRSFSPSTQAVLERTLPSLKQLVLCSATIPRRLDNFMAARFPDMERITTPNLHAIPRRVQLGVLDASREPYRNNKNLACADAVWSIGKDAASHDGPVTGEIDVKRIIVFVNEREKTQEVADYLKSKGIDALALHRDNPLQRQSEMLAEFTSPNPLKISIDRPQEVNGRRTLGNTKVIVATDLASRGIDTMAVRHVVLYDVPHTTIDFIHRLGRAGRMGRRGRGIVIVGKDDRRDIIADVRESMYMGQALV